MRLHTACRSWAAGWLGQRTFATHWSQPPACASCAGAMGWGGAASGCVPLLCMCLPVAPSHPALPFTRACRPMCPAAARPSQTRPRPLAPASCCCSSHQGRLCPAATRRTSVCRAARCPCRRTPSPCAGTRSAGLLRPPARPPPVQPMCRACRRRSAATQRLAAPPFLPPAYLAACTPWHPCLPYQLPRRCPRPSATRRRLHCRLHFLRPAAATRHQRQLRQGQQLLQCSCHAAPRQLVPQLSRLQPRSRDGICRLAIQRQHIGRLVQPRHSLLPTRPLASKA